LKLSNVCFNFTGGDRGWKGDVPIVRFDTSKLRARGWTNQRTAREAMVDAVDSMIASFRTPEAADAR